MSVYTLLNQNQLRDLLEHYPLEKIESIEPISDGIENSNYRVKTWEQDYVLTIFESEPLNKHPEFLKQILEFMDIAAKQGLPVPQPIENHNHEALGQFEFLKQRKAFVLCEMLVGEHPKSIDTELLHSLGEALAKVHALSHDNTAEASSLVSAIAFQDLSFILPDEKTDFLNTEKQKLYEEEKAFLLSLESQCQGKELSHGICHRDLFPDNTLVIKSADNGQQKLSALLDWYDLGHSYFLLDLAVVAISWCQDENNRAQLSETKVKALLGGYQNQLALSQDALELWPAFIRLAAFQFWISREIYQEKMRREGRDAHPEKNADEFYQALLVLRQAVA